MRLPDDGDRLGRDRGKPKQGFHVISRSLCVLHPRECEAASSQKLCFIIIIILMINFSILKAKKK